jgi:hypothetical protein
MRKLRLMNCYAMLLILVMLMAGCPGSSVTIKEPGAPIEWFLGVDTTPTVSPAEFAEYPQIAAESVLSCLRPRDRLYQLLINADAEREVTTFDVASGKTGVADDALKIYQSLKAIQRDQSRSVTTNLASLLSYVKKVVNEARKERQRLEQQGRPAPPEIQYVAVLLTDGLPDGRQTIEAGDWPNDVQVWVFGVKREHEAKFKQLCLEQMRIPEANLHIKQFSAWKAGVKDFGPTVGRTRNSALLNQLTTGSKTVAGL